MACAAMGEGIAGEDWEKARLPVLLVGEAFCERLVGVELRGGLGGVALALSTGDCDCDRVVSLRAAGEVDAS